MKFWFQKPEPYKPEKIHVERLLVQGSQNQQVKRTREWPGLRLLSWFLCQFFEELTVPHISMAEWIHGTTAGLLALIKEASSFVYDPPRR